MPLAAAAQSTGSSVTLYGAIDTSIRFQNNTAASSSSDTRMDSGGIGGSHFGLRGHESLGQDLYAAFRLEAGITPNTGTLTDSERLFSRESWVGLGGSWGQISAGRHYTLIHDIISMRSYDAFTVSNYAEVSWYSGTQYTIRRDNSVRYLGDFDNFEVGLMVQTNEHGVDDSYSLMAIVPVGGLDIALAHETDYAPDQKLSSSLLALKYTFSGGTSLHAFTLHSRAEGLRQRKDKLYALGIIHPVTGRTTLSGSVYHNRTDHDGRGRRNVVVVRAQYALSKRSFVYAEADHSWVRGVTVADFNDPGKVDPDTRRTSLSVGYRHLF